MAFFLVAGNQKEGRFIGSGHVRVGEQAREHVRILVPGKTADCISTCRDIDQRQHIWSYAGKHKRLRKGHYLNLGKCFEEMYPETPVPPSASDG